MMKATKFNKIINKSNNAINQLTKKQDEHRISNIKGLRIVYNKFQIRKFLWRISHMLITVFLFVSLVTMSIMASHSLKRDAMFLRSREELNNNLKSVENYVLNNKDKFFIYDLDVAQNYASRTNFGQNDLSNMLVWGSSYIYTPPYYQQIEKYGFEEITAETFFEPNVFFITSKDNKNNRDLLMAYINKDISTATIEEIDEIAGFSICKINLSNEMY